MTERAKVIAELLTEWAGVDIMDEMLLRCDLNECGAFLKVSHQTQKITRENALKSLTTIQQTLKILHILSRYGQIQGVRNRDLELINAQLLVKIEALKKENDNLKENVRL